MDLLYILKKPHLKLNNLLGKDCCSVVGLILMSRKTPFRQHLIQRWMTNVCKVFSPHAAYNSWESSLDHKIVFQDRFSLFPFNEASASSLLLSFPVGLQGHRAGHSMSRVTDLLSPRKVHVPEMHKPGDNAHLACKLEGWPRTDAVLKRTCSLRRVLH